MVVMAQYRVLVRDLDGDKDHVNVVQHHSHQEALIFTNRGEYIYIYIYIYIC